MRPRGTNIFVNFLDLLKVKHTWDFSNQFYNEHPHKYNLFGLSKMLSDYGIENAGIRVADKEKDIVEIETPFIAHFGGDFVVVHKMNENEVFFLWRGADHTLPVAKFVEAWTGIALLAESSEKSIEPDYHVHRKKELFIIAQKSVLAIAGILILGIIFINQSLFSNLRFLTLLIINSAGVYISWLLLLKQMHIQSQYADKICSLFKQSDCNNILEVKEAKLWGIFSWSEIGLGYFSANILLLLLFPQSVYLLALLNIFTLPFSFWSVWYQKVRARQWCVLCLIVQVLLWAIFVVNCLFGFIQMPAFDFKELLSLIFIGSCYGASVLGINMLVPKFTSDRTIRFLRQSINALKANEEVFKAILKQQPHFETSDSNSIIRFGNPGSLLQLTILTNPYCYPCSMMHRRIEKLLHKTNNISIQYMLSSFEESLNSTNKYLIAVCLKSDSNSIKQIFTDWFEKGKELRDEYFKDMNLYMTNPEIETEFQKHEEWRKKTQIRATPTVLVNGYKLPDNYKIEDLRYFTDV